MPKVLHLERDKLQYGPKPVEISRINRREETGNQAANTIASDTPMRPQGAGARDATPTIMMQKTKKMRKPERRRITDTDSDTEPAQYR